LISVKAARPGGCHKAERLRGGFAMLTWEDCLGLCELSEEEVRAIALHEHIPMMAAVELGFYLVRTAHGAPRISRMIIDDIRAASVRGDTCEAAKLKSVLRHFVETHRPAPVTVTPACCCG
jgi:hypothetical protein